MNPSLVIWTMEPKLKRECGGGGRLIGLALGPVPSPGSASFSFWATFLPPVNFEGWRTLSSKVLSDIVIL